MCAGDQKEHFWDENGEQYIGVVDFRFHFWSVTVRLRITLGPFCHKIILQFMIKGFAVKFCII